MSPNDDGFPVPNHPALQMQNRIEDGRSLISGSEEFHPHTWDELREIINANRLEDLKRSPSETRRYLTWMKQINSEYGSVTRFICQEKLQWKDLHDPMDPLGPRFTCQSAIPFEDSDDYKILKNDWPYGLAPGITHIVVWLKNRVMTDDKTGDMTPGSRHLVERFVNSQFVQRSITEGSTNDDVLWFKNWAALQSVRGLEHIHVLVRNVSQNTLDEWTRTRLPDK